MPVNPVGKTTMTTYLTKELNCSLYCTPPDCLTAIRPLFEDDKLLRTAYYALGNYIANMQLKVLLQDKPVILDRSLFIITLADQKNYFMHVFTDFGTPQQLMP